MLIVGEEAATNKKRGFALVFVMAFAAIIVVFTASVGAQASFNLRLAANRGEVDRAYYSAQTGTHLILSLLREPPPTLDYDGDGNVGSWLGEDASLRLTIESTNAEAIAHVYHNIQGFPNPTLVAPDGTNIPIDRFYIISMGVVNGVYDGSGDLQSGVKYEATTMGATLNPSFPMTPHAIFGYERIDVDGVVAHFDSRPAGPWAIADGGSGGDNMACTVPEASVGIADVDEASIVIGPDARIDGHILFGYNTPRPAKDDEQSAIAGLPGAAGTPPTVIHPGGGILYAEANTDSAPGGHSHVNGDINSLASPRDAVDMNPDPVDVEAHLSGSGSLTLNEGSIYIKDDDLTLIGSDTITVQDTNGDGDLEDVILIVDGDISFLGATIGSNGATKPRNLKIYSRQAGSSFNMDNSEAFCIVAGEDMDADITGNSTLWGAVLARDVTLESGSAVHFDVALRDPLEIADIYGFYLTGSSVSSGARVATGAMGPNGTTAPAPAPAPAPAGPGPAPAPAPAPTGGGCGCGCGCGSMLVMNKL